jgi:hypothetical protein
MFVGCSILFSPFRMRNIHDFRRFDSMKIAEQIREREMNLGHCRGGILPFPPLIGGSKIDVGRQRIVIRQIRFCHKIKRIGFLHGDGGNGID